ncbi:site-specific integrase [Mariniblastus sp.]|nr:site-specific integrase [Mariniblastus sp.]
MSRETSSEVIQCPNFAWRLFKRGGTYYADGRKHNSGKKSLAVGNRKDAIRELQLLDKLTGLESAAESKSNAVSNRIMLSANQPFEPIEIEAGWQLYIDRRSIPIHIGGLKPSSIRKYQGHKKRFVAYCNKNKINCWSSVDRKLLEDYAKVLDKKLAPITIHDDLTMEISVSNWLIKDKQIPIDCKINWKLQKPPGAERYCYERDEVSRMLEFSAELTKNRWLYPTTLLLSHTGLRIGEAINLRWPDIDLRRGVIHIRDESFKKNSTTQRRLVKDRESRVIPIHPKFQSYLTGCGKTSGYVLTGDQGRKLNYNHALDMLVKKLIQPLEQEFPTPTGELGFKDGRFHSFRHFFVSECFDAGIPESDIKDWVGHSDSKVVNLYKHIRSESAKANMSLGKFGSA